MKYTVSIDKEKHVVWIYKEMRSGKIVRSFWSMASFQPPIDTALLKGKRYRGVVSYDTQNLPSGKVIRIPKSIKVGTKTYCNLI